MSVMGEVARQAAGNLTTASGRFPELPGGSEDLALWLEKGVLMWRLDSGEAGEVDWSGIDEDIAASDLVAIGRLIERDVYSDPEELLGLIVRYGLVQEMASRLAVPEPVAGEEGRFRIPPRIVDAAVRVVQEWYADDLSADAVGDLKDALGSDPPSAEKLWGEDLEDPSVEAPRRAFMGTEVAKAEERTETVNIAPSYRGLLALVMAHSTDPVAKAILGEFHKLAVIADGDDPRLSISRKVE